MCVNECFYGGGEDDGIDKQFGDTSLTCAADFGKLDCARLLLEAGADTEAKDSVRDLCSSIRVFVDGIGESMRFIMHAVVVPRLIFPKWSVRRFRVSFVIA